VIGEGSDASSAGGMLVGRVKRSIIFGPAFAACIWLEGSPDDPIPESANG
jgi:hypothetical protein